MYRRTDGEQLSELGRGIELKVRVLREEGLSHHRKVSQLQKKKYKTDTTLEIAYYC